MASCSSRFQAVFQVNIFRDALEVRVGFFEQLSNNGNYMFNSLIT